MVAGSVIQLNETSQGELFALFLVASLKDDQGEKPFFFLNWQRFACPVEILANQVQSTAVFTGQIIL